MPPPVNSLSSITPMYGCATQTLEAQVRMACQLIAVIRSHSTSTMAYACNKAMVGGSV
jgi:hypothetical protein